MASMFLTVGWIASVVVILLSNCGSTAALNCFNCANVELKEDSSSEIKRLFSGSTNADPSCGHRPSSNNVISCQPGYVCGAFNGDVSTYIPILGKMHVQAQVRSCIEESSAGPIGICKKADRSVMGVVNAGMKLLTFASELPLSGVELDGKMCFCNNDLCTADMCDGGFSISGICIYFWILGVIAAVIVALCCGCCYCCCRSCCCCCCEKKQQGMVLSPMFITTTTTSSQVPTIQGFANPMSGYTINQGVESAQEYVVLNQVDDNMVTTISGKDDRNYLLNAGYDQP